MISEDLNRNHMQLGEINLKLKVAINEFWNCYIVTDDNYEPGFPLGNGYTIQEAIDDYLDKAHEFYIEKWNHSTLKYTWS